MEELLQKLNIIPKSDIAAIKEELEFKIKEATEKYNEILTEKNKSEEEKKREEQLKGELDLLEDALKTVNWIIKSISAGLNAEKTDVGNISGKTDESDENMVQELQKAQASDKTWADDTVKIYEECLKAAENGDPEAQYKLAHMYYSGDNALKDKNRASYWLHKAAESGNICSQYELGMMLYSGDGISKNEEEGIRWLEISAANGYDKAILKLFELFTDRKEFERLKTLYKRYNQEIKSKLGMETIELIINAYYEQSSVIKDNDDTINKEEDSDIFHWCLKISEDKDTGEAILGKAEYLLGRMYQEGRVVERDLDESIKWYEKQ